MKKEIKNAKIINVYTSFNEENLTLDFNVKFKYEGGGINYSFLGNNQEDMFYLSALLDYIDYEYGDLNDVLTDKEFRLVVGGTGRLLAIGHPTEDKFFRTRDCFNAHLSLSEI